MTHQPSQPSREKAVKLALLLGWAGGHRFYTHQPLSGLAYLLFCWTFIPVLLSFIDAAFLARMSDDDFAEEYCSLDPSAQFSAVRTSKNKSRNGFDLTA